MKRASIVVAALLASVAALAADPPDAPPSDPSAKTFKASFIGEGGGYKQADSTTEGYMVGGQTGLPGSEIPSAAAAADPSSGPSAKAAPQGGPQAAAAVAPSGSLVRPGAPAPSGAGRAFSARAVAAQNPVAAREGSEASSPARSTGRQSLWNGLMQPLSMTASKAAEAQDPDAARADSDRDYETHILGAKPSAERPSLKTPDRPAAAPESAEVASTEGGKVFVSLEIDPKEAGSLHDAVAGLGASVGFAADPRFQAVPGAGGNVLFSGWMPAGKLGAAMSRPGVKRLRVEPRARPSAPRETNGEFLIGLRVDDASRAKESVDAGVGVLSSQAGFRLSRVVGLETAPDGHSVAVVAGLLPLSRLSKAMGLSQVAKIVPAGRDIPAPAAPSAAAAKPGLAGFAGFAMKHGPWLIILTLLLLLPSLREPARRAASVFNPYR